MSTTVRAPSAIAVGLGFTGVTLYVLLEDVFKHGAPITTSHIMTVAVLTGTIYFGHKFTPLLRQFNPWCLGCAILFLAGTLYCVVSSAGRNADTLSYKALVANNTNAERERVRLDLAEAKARYQSAMTAEAAECGTGRGSKCQGRQSTTQQTRADLTVAEAAWRAMPTEQVANGDMRAAAEMLSKLPGVTMPADEIEASLLLGFPFLRALFCEIAAIVAFGFGLGHRRQVPAPVAAPAPVALVSEPVSTPPPATKAPVVELPADNVVRLPPVKFKKARTTDQQYVTDALDRLGGVAESNDQLAETMGVLKGESSKRVSNCLEAGIITATRRGRYLEIRRAIEAA